MVKFCLKNMMIRFTIYGEPASPITYIYALVDPDTGQPRYVGKSDNPIYRFRRHLKDDSDTHKSRWIRTLLRNGKFPKLRVLQAVRFDEWQEAERYWIAQFRYCELTNSTEGGIGPLRPSDETREKMRQRKLGRRITREHALKVSAALKGRPKPKRTLEHAQALSMSCKGRIITQDQRSKLAIATMRRRATSACGLKGVYFDQSRGNYQALIKIKRKIIHLGRYATALEAAVAYNNEAMARGWPHEGLNPL